MELFFKKVRQGDFSIRSMYLMRPCCALFPSFEESENGLFWFSDFAE